MAKRFKKKNRTQETAQVARSRSGALSSITNRKFFLLKMLTIVVAGLWVFWPALSAGWLWDDDELVVRNSLVHDPEGIWKIWLEPVNYLIDYFPLKTSVEWLEWQLWPNDPFGYHLVNIILHLLGSLLIWRLLSKFDLRFAWLGGLLFAIHPITVESVAWVSELKNTLSLPLFLGAMCFFIDYDEHGKRKDYFLALGLFLAAMLCKTSMVMFPMIILLYIWWKRGRIGWNDLKISAPFFAVSFGLGLVTIWFLHHYAITQNGIAMGGFFSHLALAGLSLAFYFSKCFLPVGLLPVYPKWVIDPPSLIQFLPWLVLGGMIYWLWRKRTGWGRHALLGFGFFLIALAPFIGFTPGSYMDFTWVMDHFLYIPLIGLIGLVVAGLEQIRNQLPAATRSFAIGIVVLVMALLAWGSHAYAEMFVSEETFWSYTIQHNPNAWLAYHNLAFALVQSGRIDEAIPYYEQALKLKPDYVEAHSNLGIALSQANRVPEAIEHYLQAIKINPRYVEAYNNLGIAWAKDGKLTDAIEQYEIALKIRPNYADAHSNMANALFRANRVSEAIEHYQLAIKYNPNYADAYNNLGSVYGQTGQVAQAIAQFEQAIRIDPNHADAHRNLGYALSQSNRIPEAIEQYEITLKINPKDATAQTQLAQLQQASPGLQSTPIKPQGDSR